MYGYVRCFMYETKIIFSTIDDASWKVSVMYNNYIYEHDYNVYFNNCQT